MHKFTCILTSSKHIDTFNPYVFFKKYTMSPLDTARIAPSSRPGGDVSCDSLEVSPETLTREIEVKYIVDPSLFPDSLRKQLESGKHYPDSQTHEYSNEERRAIGFPHVVQRGRISQLYLPINETTLSIALSIIEELPEGTVTAADLAYFKNPENITELRILQREQGHLGKNRLSSHDEPLENMETKHSDAFQITLKGKANADGSARPNIETPITTNKRLAEAVVQLLESLHPGNAEPGGWQQHVKTVNKMWYDIAISDPNNPLGKPLNVELDIFPDINYLAVAEIEFPSEQQLQAARDHLPPWFFADVTSNSAFKVRNLAGKRSIEEIVAADLNISGIIEQIRDALKPIYVPTVLGEIVQIPPELSQLARFVLIGSFRKWLPQFRYIGQDLRKKSAGVYPDITTLDIARRQAQALLPGSPFRIEQERGKDFLTAEKSYLSQIKAADAVYLVAPEGRLGETSAQEAIYAVQQQKKLFLMTRVLTVSRDLPHASRILILALIDKFRDMSDQTLHDTHVTSMIGDHLRHLLRRDQLMTDNPELNFDEDFCKKLAAENMDVLMATCKKRDEKSTEASPQEVTKS